MSGLADFSASGPTPLSLRLKPDVSAPGVSILSSVPNARWETMSGTSMASPQIAGAAALLIERHPSWSVAMLKAALIGSGSDVDVDGQVAAPTRGGGGLANPLKADVPLVLAEPASVSFGLVRPGVTVPARVDLTDAGGGAGDWSVTVDTVTATAGAGLVAPPTVSAPGALDLSAVVTATAAEGDLTGFVRLTRGADVRRIPFWLRVTRPGLAAAAASRFAHPACTRGDTRGKPSLASRYRYPDVPAGGAVSAVLQGPEQVFRVTLTTAGGELRGRHRPPRRRSPGRAPRHLGGRREPPHRVRSPARQSQPLPGPVRCARPRSRRRAAALGHATTSSSTVPRTRAPALQRSASGSTTRGRRRSRSSATGYGEASR